MGVYNKSYLESVKINNTGRDIIIDWVNDKKNNKLLSEIFVIRNRYALSSDLKNFLKQEFLLGRLKPIHSGLSTTEFNPNDWLESISDNIINHMIQYFESIRGQTERDSQSGVNISD